MNTRFLILKQAYIEDVSVRYGVQQDIDRLQSFILGVFPDASIEHIAVTEEGEWLLHGRSVRPTTHVQMYTHVYICIHTASPVYDSTYAYAKSHAKKIYSLYHASDTLFHHAVRLEELIHIHKEAVSKDVSVKIPYQVHVPMLKYNQESISSEHIAHAHIRKVFLPVHVLESNHYSYLKGKQGALTVDEKRLAYTPAELSTHIDAIRHDVDSITFREHIKSPEVYVVSIPDFRNESIYVGLPCVHKRVQNTSVWDLQKLTTTENTEIQKVVQHISSVAFNDKSVVYGLSVHAKRGVFVQYTVPLLHFVIHHPEFFALCTHEHGISKEDLFDRL